MKRITMAAALIATGLVSAAPAGAVPLGTKAGCATANASAVAASSSCRFLADATAFGYAGVTDTGWQITYKANRVASVGPGGCAASYQIVTVTVASGGAGPAGSQRTFTPGVVYTVTVSGTGEMQAGGRGTVSSMSEPADAVADETGGVPPC